jgi:hypothetical protein
MGWDGGSILLHPGAGGWHTVAHGVAARTEEVAVARASVGGRRPPGGLTWVGVARGAWAGEGIPMKKSSWAAKAFRPN